MIISKIGRYLILVNLAAAVSFRGANVRSLNDEPYLPNAAASHRGLQDCSATKKNECKAPCVWDNGTRSCGVAPTPPPTTAQPTNQPVNVSSSGCSL